MVSGDRGLIRLGASRWWMHPEFVLRSAGFPVADVRVLCDEEAASAADSELSDAQFAPIYKQAEQRTAEAIRHLAGDNTYREAIAWQNPGFIEMVDKLADDAQMSQKRRRQRTSTFVNYVQRYCTKNDTIGFFGPIAWSWITPGSKDLSVRPGPGLVRTRAVFFEWWAIDMLARIWSDDPEVVPWLRPVVAEHLYLHDGTLHGPRGRTRAFEPGERSLIEQCDGTHTLAELSAARPEADVPGLVRTWAEQGFLTMDLSGPFEPFPERTLRGKLARIGDEPTRDRLIAALDELAAARDQVAASAGRSGAVQAALRSLNETFERISDTSSSRRRGEAYAGRAVVYEDTSRDIDIELGSLVLDAIADPLSLVLDSAAWIVEQAAAGYEERFRLLFAKYAARTGLDTAPLDALVGSATRELDFARESLSPLVAELSERLARKWQEILAVPTGVSRFSIRSSDIAERARAAFRSGALPWSAARHHCPDFMIVAPDAAAVARGEFQVVLGEIHLALNTLDGRAVTSTHPDPDRLRGYSRADHGTRRVVPVPSRFSLQVNSRTYPPVLLSEDFTYWTMHPHSTGAPGDVTPAAALEVTARGDRMVVVDVRTGRWWNLTEVVGDLLSATLLNAFAITPPARHRSRVTIDNLVVARELWTFETTELTWSDVGAEGSRFRRIRRWRAENALPRRVFYRVAGEVKPLYLDFASPALVNLAAAMIRRATRHDPRSTVEFSEMLPEPDDCWLVDDRGRRYTSEFRLVLMDPDME
ncbi:MAG: lantibiotic dehydratase [Streptomyces sp.]|uniref:lantibiotic dehydratase n=1 Tax=Streptomyces sp. TaxID=1931 RepID=UPI0025F971F3|nr:lantibiotic dehydratase [Streptomyces sp.]MBW8799886.1 lantibiotic dehydratase [Streptomyces sp.]